MTKKKIKLSTTNLVIIILIISIALIGIKETYDGIQYKKTDTIVGEIVHIKDGLTAAKGEKRKIYLHIRPIGQDDGVLFPFTFTNNSTPESEYSVNISDMPEFTVGNVVEIEYRISDVKYLSGKEIISIRSVEASEDMDYSVELVKNEKYRLLSKNSGLATTGTVHSVVRMEGYGGYLVYTLTTWGEKGKLIAFWIDDEIVSLVGDDIKEALKSGCFDGEVLLNLPVDEQVDVFTNYECTVAYGIRYLRVK